MLADTAYDGAGTGIHTPVKEPAGSPVLHPTNQAYNALLARLRALGGRAHAVLIQRWRALQHITLDPTASATSPAPPSSSPASNNHKFTEKTSVWCRAVRRGTSR